jgi:hypothetical protein
MEERDKMEQQALKNVNNRTAHIRHQCRKTTVFGCQRCLINSGAKNELHLNIN